MSKQVVAVVCCLLILLFPGCTNDDNVSTAGFHTVRNRFVFCGEWGGCNTIYYGATLVIKDDSTFEYIASGCVGGSQTKGKWTCNESRIILTSLDSYIPPKDSITTSAIVDSNDGRPVLHVSVGRSADVFCMPVYFDHIVLERHRDTLLAVDALPDGIGYFIRHSNIITATTL